MKKVSLIFAMVSVMGISAFAQQPAEAPAKPYSIIIKGGHVIDPKNNIDEVMDIAIEAAPARTFGQGGAQGRQTPPERKIAKVAKNIDPKLAVQVVDAKGLFVTPGLIDLHVHVFWGTDLTGQYRNGPSSIPPDGFTFKSGVTTVVDAGSSGYKTFETFKKQTIDRSQTRVLAMLNIVGPGMDGADESKIEEMDAEKAGEMIKKYPKDIVGVKLAHFAGPAFSGHTWVPTDRAIQAASIGGVPLMVDFGSANPYLPLDSLFNVKFRPGDIYTHAFGGDPEVGISTQRGRESIVDIKANKVKDYVYAARKKGVIFDVGFGGSSFLFSQGLPAIKAKFYPNSISTDQHVGSYNNAMKDMQNIMGLFLAMGMPLKDVITASTWNPAKEIHREELGNLSEGSVADIAIFNLRKGNFGYWARDGKIAGKDRLETEMTIRNGAVVYNMNGRIEPLNPPGTPRPTGGQGAGSRQGANPAPAR